MSGQQTLEIVKEADKVRRNIEESIRHTMQEIGKRIAPPDTKPDNVEGVAVECLLGFIERVERLEEEKKGLSSDISDIYAEGKGAGYDIKVMREIIKLRRMPAIERNEWEYLRDTYLRALEM